MKVQGLNAKDADEIDRAFRWVLGEQLLRARSYAQDGNIGACLDFIDAAKNMLTTYEKVAKQLDKYETEKKK